MPEILDFDIASEASKVLADVIPISRLHGQCEPDLSVRALQVLGTLGWFSLDIEPADGGGGLPLGAVAYFFREVGRYIGPVDILTQYLAVHTTRSADRRNAFASGTERLALVANDCEVPGAGSLRVLGGGREAGFALRARRTGAQIFKINAQDLRPISSLDPAVGMYWLDGGEMKLVEECPGPQVWHVAQLATTAMLVGIAESALKMIVEYAKVRQTFGRPIGSYQAVRHPCADMALRAESAACQLWYAAAALAKGDSDAAAHLAAAKYLANKAALANTDTNIQLHGGIGIADEFDAHLLLKHALLLTRLFGSDRPLLKQLLHADVYVNTSIMR